MLGKRFNSLREELGQHGVRIALDDFDNEVQVAQRVSAITPPLLVPEAEELPIAQEEQGVETDQRSAEQIRAEALGSSTEETTADAAELLQGVDQSWQRAIDIGFSEPDNLRPFTPNAEGEVRTKGL